MNLIDTYYQFYYSPSINIYLYLKKLLTHLNIKEDNQETIIEYIIPFRQHNIKILYLLNNNETLEEFIHHTYMDFNLFIYQLTKTIIFKYKYFKSKQVIALDQKDMLLLSKITQSCKQLIIDNQSLFFKLFIEIYLDFFNKKQYHCLYYNSYFDINEKYYNILNNSIIT